MAIFTTITNIEFYDALKLDAVFDGETNWSINKNAKSGDTVLLYVCAPVSAIVATAIVSDSPARDEDLKSEWFGKYFADMSDLRMLEKSVTRSELLRKFPHWRYWTQPRNSIKVPDVFVGALEKLLGEN